MKDIQFNILLLQNLDEASFRQVATLHGGGKGRHELGSDEAFGNFRSGKRGWVYVLACLRFLVDIGIAVREEGVGPVDRGEGKAGRVHGGL